MLNKLAWSFGLPPSFATHLCLPVPGSAHPRERTDCPGGGRQKVMAKQTPGAAALGPWCHFNDFCAGSVFTSTLPNPAPLCTRLPGTATQRHAPTHNLHARTSVQSGHPLPQLWCAWLCPASLGSDGDQGSRGSVCREGPAVGTLAPTCADPVWEGCSGLGGTPWFRVWLRYRLSLPLPDAQAGTGPSSSPLPLASCQSLKKGI